MLLINVELRAQKLQNAPTGNFALPTHLVPRSLRQQSHHSLHHPHHHHTNSVELLSQTLQRNVGNHAPRETRTAASD